MKGFLISDNMDTLVGLRIAGINGVVLHERDEILYMMNRIVEDKEIGIIILTEKVAAIVEDKIKEMKLSKTIPLIVEIPDRHGSNKGKDYILRYVRESIGLKI
ncbi:MAG: Vacuolar H+transporting two-sector ATPase Fsubunit [Clostridiales bacterium]|jgi:V/A-type H+-transporting ATPase subunit F|nr:Vacuolar H+transporting two-sector ATPase Fsubunit [Clostridiales bacterium]